MLKLELATKAFTATRLKKKKKNKVKKQGEKKKTPAPLWKETEQPTFCLRLSTSDINLRYFPFKDADKI